MSATLKSTIEDLNRVTGKAELVDGEMVHMSPTGAAPGYTATEIFVSLHEHSRQTRIGRAVIDNAAFSLDLANRGSFSPDAAYHTGKPTGLRFFEGSPVFAVEVEARATIDPKPRPRWQESDVATLPPAVWWFGMQICSARCG